MQSLSITTTTQIPNRSHYGGFFQPVKLHRRREIAVFLFQVDHEESQEQRKDPKLKTLSNSKKVTCLSHACNVVCFA